MTSKDWTARPGCTMLCRISSERTQKNRARYTDLTEHSKTILSREQSKRCNHETLPPPNRRGSGVPLYSSCRRHRRGDMRTAIVRLDGEPELTKPVYAAAPELADMLEEICDTISFSPDLYNLIGHERYHRARAVLKKA